MEKIMKSCCSCRHERDPGGMISFLDEGVRRYACNPPCQATYIIRRNAERSREERLDVV